MNSDTRKTVIRLYEDGFSEAGIAASLGVSEYEVAEMVGRLNNLMKAPSLVKTARAKVFELRAEGHSPSEIARILDVPQKSVEQTIEKDRSKIKNDSRAQECLEMYKNGASLEEIGNKFGITRERARQITKKQFAYELGYGPVEQRARKAEIAKSYRSVVEDSRAERQQEQVEKKYNEAVAKGLEPEYFDSVAKFCDAIGVSKDMLKEYVPVAYTTLVTNERRKSKRWSWHYDQCRMCGTTSVKHRGYGYCENCYTKSPEFKEAQRRAHLKNRDAILAKNREYARERQNDPEVLAKIESDYDLKYFGGNRKFALERDGYKCLGCGMSINVKDKVGRSVVRVWHLKDKDDHSLDNLGTYCQSCLFKYRGINSFNNFGRPR